MLRTALMVCAISMCGEIASAEPTLYLLVNGDRCETIPRCIGSRIVEIDIGARRIVGEYWLPADAAQLHITADGRYLFWADYRIANTSYLRVFDVPTKQIYTLQPWPFDSRMLAHPLQVRAFLSHINNSVVVVEPGVTSALEFPNCQVGTLEGISGNGDRLQLNCVTAPTVGANVVVDAAGGATIGSVPDFIGAETLNWAGDELFSLEEIDTSTTTIPTTIIHRRQVPGGAELASQLYTHPYGTGLGGEPLVDPRTGRVFVARLTELLAFDSSTLVPLGQIPFGFTSGIGPLLTFDPNRPRAYQVTQPANGGAARLTVIDTDSVAVVESAILPFANFPSSIFTNTVADLVIAPHPLPPANLSAAVTDRRVSLSWEIPDRSPALTHFVIEAGSAPGLANTARVETDTAALTLTAESVPSGTYHVRVRAANFSGTGPASNEIVVTVP